MFSNLPFIEVWLANWHAKDVLPGAFTLFPASWQVLRRNWEAFAELIAIPFIIMMAGAGGVLLTHGHFGAKMIDVIGALLMFTGVALYLFVVPAIFYAQLQSVRGNSFTSLDALRGSLHFTTRVWLIVLCTYLMVAGGLAVFLIPTLLALHYHLLPVNFLIVITMFFVIGLAFFVLRRYLLAPFFAIDEDTNFMASFHRSAQISAKYSPSIWNAMGVYCIFLAIARFVPVAGSLIAIVLAAAYSCAFAIRYEQIRVREISKTERKQTRATQKKSQRRSKKKS